MTYVNVFDQSPLNPPGRRRMLLGGDLALDVVHRELCPQITADLRLRRLVLRKRVAEPLGGGHLAPAHERVIG